ncbi:Crp/Fnr family transcriptional regulator [Robertkochia solimangrovi]|uniref:Crp/Fnr family transcriptional regulator n=1 Tax=Robertkochia solimangrovi TaxID=2213046 RepID=UPI00117C26AB|nr:Crp/Fnr family transcriptional regulator [Robertkochia solimangrovi]TRZ42422.1 Crp/Fnr family transcriptional regulator [Robertkochia solimangrovi]
MEQLIDYILQFGTLNKNQIELVLDKTTITDLPKDAYFAEAGKSFKHRGFILEGVLRICYYNNQGEEITKYFIEENHFIANPYDEEHISEYIQAATDCKLLIFSSKDWKELSDTIIDWESIINKIYRKAMMEKMDRRSSLVSEDATTRYLSFLEKFPTLINRIPLSYVASYLGMTQSSLSRIRKNIR